MTKDNEVVSVSTAFLKDNKSKVLKWSFDKIAVKDLVIHPKAQRELNKRKVAKLVAEMDLNAIGLINVVRMNVHGVSRYAVIDGQHRVVALVEAGYKDMIVQVLVHNHVLTDAQACQLFLRLDDRTAIPPFSKFAAELHSELPAVVDITNIALGHGLKIKRSSSTGCLTCVVALKHIYTRYGRDVLSNTLRFISKAWDKDAESFDGRLVSGLAILLSKRGAEIDESSLIKILSKARGGPSGIIGNGLGLRSYEKMAIGKAVAKVILSLYNNHRKEDSKIKDL